MAPACDLRMIRPLLDAMADVPRRHLPWAVDAAESHMKTVSLVRRTFEALLPEGRKDPFVGVRTRIDDSIGGIQIDAPGCDDPERPLRIRIANDHMRGISVDVRIDRDGEHRVEFVIEDPRAADVAHALNTLRAELRNALGAIIAAETCRAVVAICLNLEDPVRQANASRAHAASIPILSAIHVAAEPLLGRELLSASLGHAEGCGAPVFRIQTGGGLRHDDIVVPIVPEIASVVGRAPIHMASAVATDANDAHAPRIRIFTAIAIEGIDLPSDPFDLARLVRTVPDGQMRMLEERVMQERPSN